MKVETTAVMTSMSSHGSSNSKRLEMAITRALNNARKQNITDPAELRKIINLVVELNNN